jgi:hypothetical protein
MIEADREASEECGLGVAGLPAGTELISTNTAVASVEGGTSIIFKGFGATILQLRRNGAIRAWYELVFTPVPPGNKCLTEVSGPQAVVDCAGQCMPAEVVLARLGDRTCDDGAPRPDGQPPIDLSCASFTPELLLNAALDHREGGFFTSSEILARLGSPDQLYPGGSDGGDCSLDRSCIAQFGTAPGFELCRASASICSFNATTPGFELCRASASVCSFNATTGGGTCADMCQRFGSRCVAALDNNPSGCTPLLTSTDTCETPRQTEICVCEQR